MCRGNGQAFTVGSVLRADLCTVEESRYALREGYVLQNQTEILLRIEQKNLTGGVLIFNDHIQRTEKQHIFIL